MKLSSGITNKKLSFFEKIMIYQHRKYVKFDFPVLCKKGNEMLFKAVDFTDFTMQQKNY